MSGWYADGRPLSTYAFNVRNRSAGWKVPGRRGENQVVPGRSGSIPLEYGPSEDGAVSLEMWAVGADLDGELPVDKTSREQCLANLDLLTRIFGSGRLVEIVRTEEGVDYNRRNLLLNPSFESTDARQQIRENVIANPSGEYSKSRTAARWNLLLNPSAEAARREQVWRTNLVRNPRFMAEGTVQVIRRNLCTNPSFEQSLKTWKPDNNTLVQRTTARFAAGWPIRGGKYTARIESKAAGSRASILGGGYNVDGGVTYRIGADYRSAIGTIRPQVGSTPAVNDPRTVRVAVQWKNKNGDVVGSSTVGQATVVSGDIGRIEADVSAPGNARTASIRLVLLNPAGKGERVFWDGVMLEKASSADRWFDGRSSERDGLRHRWTDERGLSVSEQYVVRPRGWKGNRDDCIVAMSSDEARRGLYSMKGFVLTTGGGGMLAHQEFMAAARVGGRKIVSASVAVRPHESLEGQTRTMGIRLECWDSKGDSLGACLVSNGGAEATAQVVTLDDNGWTQVEIEGVYTRPGTSRVSIYLTRGGTWQAGDSFYVDTALVEQAAGVGTWFDGARASDDTFSFEWAGQKHWSNSHQSGAHVRHWTARDGFQWQTKNPKAGDYALTVVPNRAIDAADRIGIEQTIIEEVRVGRWHTASAYVNPNRTQSVQCQIGVVVGGVTTWTLGPVTPCTAGSWTRVWTSVEAPDDCDALVVRWRSGSAPQQADEIDFDQMMCEPVGDLRRWFSGNSGEEYNWLGEEHLSVSAWRPQRANGWGSWGSAAAALYQEEGGNASAHCVRAWGAQDGTLGLTSGSEDVVENEDYALGIDVRCSASRSGRVQIVWRNQDNVVISRTFETVSLTANVWQRVSLVAQAPQDAVSAAPVVLVDGATSGMTLDVDRAIFGYGTNTTFADGDSGGGWRWVGEQGLSESEQTRPTADFWRSSDLTVLRHSAWASDDTYSAMVTVTDDDRAKFWPVPGGVSESAEYRAEVGQRYSTAIDVKAVNAVRIVPVMVPLRWTGGSFRQTGDLVYGTPTDVEAGALVRVLASGIPVPKIGNVVTTYPVDSVYPGAEPVLHSDRIYATHFRLEFRVEAFGGGPPTVGTKFAIDKAILTTGWDTTYFDGDGPYHEWMGEENKSQSRITGPARRAMVQVQSAIDMTSMAGGTRAEFTIEGTIPDVWWEDTRTLKKTYPLPRSGRVLSLTAWKGMTAPIEDPVIRLNGPFNDLTLTDMGSGAWLFIDAKVRRGETLLVNCKTWQVRRVGGPTIVGSIRHAGHPRLLPLTLEANMDYPRLKVEADSIGDGASIQITAPRKFQIA